MENCSICHKPVEDSPPNVAVHGDCWLKEMLKAQVKIEYKPEYDEG